MRHALSTLVTCAVLPALPVMVGCAGNYAASPEAVDADSNPTSAVVVVERTVATAAPKADARSSAVARFVRMRSGAVDDDALRLVGAAVDFPTLGTCSTHVAGAASASTTARAVELLDVGALSLEAAGQQTNLQARQIPDVVDLLSGVVYATQTADADALPAHSDYLVRAAGSADLDVAPFAVHAFAPDEPQDLRIAGREISGSIGSAGGNDATDASFAADEAIDITWSAGSPDDLVYVDISPSAVDGQAPATARCLFADDGKATVAPAAFGSAASGILSIHRLHREPFHVKGVDTGEVRFDFAVVVAFSRS